MEKPKIELTPAEKLAHEVVGRAIQASPHTTADRVGELIAALWDFTHIDGLPERQMIEGLCLLSGMATASLLTHADMLREREAHDDA